MDWIAQAAEKYGLFVALVIYVLWNNREREIKYLTVIQTLSEEVKDRLTKIESKMGRRRSDGE